MRTLPFRTGPSPAHLQRGQGAPFAAMDHCHPGRCAKACAFSAGDTPDGCGERLASLQNSPLMRNFYCWRGASGDGYVCSVFAADDDATVAAFDGAAIIGVAVDGGAPRPFCILDSAAFRSPEGVDLRARLRARANCEWHVRFEAEPATFCDLAASLRH